MIKKTNFETVFYDEVTRILFANDISFDKGMRMADDFIEKHSAKEKRIDLTDQHIVNLSIGTIDAHIENLKLNGAGEVDPVKGDLLFCMMLILRSTDQYDLLSKQLESGNSVRVVFVRSGEDHDAKLTWLVDVRSNGESLPKVSEGYIEGLISNRPDSVQ